jgi:hypothetical protein
MMSAQFFAFLVAEALLNEPRHDTREPRYVRDEEPPVDPVCTEHRDDDPETVAAASPGRA